MTRAAAQITAEMLAHERARTGRQLSRPQPHVETATRDAIRHWAEGIGDRNPLWTDEAYARATVWAGLIAPPTLVLAMDKNIVKARGFPGIHSWHLGTTFEWTDVLRQDQTLTGASWVDSIEPVESQYAGGTAYNQTVRTELRDASSGARLCVANTLLRRFERDAGKRTAKYQRSKQVYSDADLAEIAEAYRCEEIRGAQPRFVEDVHVGASIGPIVRGPLSLMDCIAFVIAWGGAYVFAHGFAWDFLRQHPGVFPPNDANVPDTPERTHWNDQFAQAIGAPAAFDYGPQRIAWCGTLMTNWMGDQGALKRLAVRLLRPNYQGDTLRIGGSVTAVSPAERHVTIEFAGHNQLGERVVDGHATVALPSRGQG